MEDASKEFQIFLSPMRDYQQPYRETCKHRVVPVVTRSLVSYSSSFLLSQKKSNVYRAMSGVSFQDTDQIGEGGFYSRRERMERSERRRSYVVPRGECQQNPLGILGARRSKSLTSMESNYNNTEIIHPCTPVVLRSQSNARQNRYARLRSRRRSPSQHVRSTLLEGTKHDPDRFPKNEPPVRPRRTRSASRPRSSIVSESPISERKIGSKNSSTESFAHFSRNSKFSFNDKGIRRNSVEALDFHASKNSVLEKLKETHTTNGIDFTVNENDWQKYDVLVSKKLDNILKGKEEPEGGYFSLEREETLETLGENSTGGEYFQKDKSSESLYVMEVVTKKPHEDLESDLGGVTVEDGYRDVFFDSQPQEVGFIDDEGLYEEIIFENKDSVKNMTSYPNQTYGITSTINIKVGNDKKESNATQEDIKVPGNTTVVYIGGQKEGNIEVNSHCIKSSESSRSEENKEQELEQSRITINFTKGTTLISTNAESKHWCSCSAAANGSNGVVANHASCCIQSKPTYLSSKYSSSGDPKHQNPSHRSFPNLAKIVGEKSSTPPKVAAASCDGLADLDFELSDIDLTMFHPRNKDQLRSAKSATAGSVSEMRQNHQNTKRAEDSEKDSKESTVKKLLSPIDFKSFLQNSIFNPQIDSPSEGGETLIIKDDRAISCITDTSSSDEDISSESENEKSISSPWREAKNDFEFVAAKDDRLAHASQPQPPPQKNVSKKKINFTKLFSISSTSSGPLQHQPDVLPVSAPAPAPSSAPARPSRKRRRKKIF